jgi:hypothetical protein
MMAAIAKWRDDASGNLVTGGTAAAITITTNQGLTALTDGFSVTARITTSNALNATLAVDGLTAKAIATDTGAAGIPSGAAYAGQIHTFTYDSSADKWIIHGRFGDTMTNDNNPDLINIENLAGTTGALRKTAANTWALDDGVTNLLFVKDNNSTAFSTGIAGDIHVPFACTITGVFLFSDQTGSIVLDLWKDTYANYPPLVGDSIVASAKPTIAASTKATDTTLTGWTTSVAAGDIIRVNIDSVSSITRFTLAIRVKRFI